MTRILKKVDGVTNIDTSVENKSVVVTHDASVEPSLLNEKLQKVRLTDRLISEKNRYSIQMEPLLYDDEDIIIILLSIETNKQQSYCFFVSIFLQFNPKIDLVYNQRFCSGRPLLERK